MLRCHLASHPGLFIFIIYLKSSCVNLSLQEWCVDVNLQDCNSSWKLRAFNTNTFQAWKVLVKSRNLLRIVLAFLKHTKNGKLVIYHTTHRMCTKYVCTVYRSGTSWRTVTSWTPDAALWMTIWKRWKKMKRKESLRSVALHVYSICLSIYLKSQD